MEESDVFNDNWFGALHPDDGIVKEGRWAYTPISTVDTDTFSIYSPYSLARSPWNANNVEYLTRYSDFYGSSFTLMPTCTSHYNLMFDESLYEFGYNAQYLPHGVVHSVMGGVTNSDVYDTMRSYGMGLANSDYLSSSMFVYQKNLWRFGAYTCQSDCSTDTDPLDCACSCPSLEMWKNKDQLSYITTLLGLSKDTLESKTGVDLTEVFVDAMCNSEGTSSPMIGDMLESGSPIDPLFWPIHPAMERLFFRWTMTGDRDEEWFSF